MEFNSGFKGLKAVAIDCLRLFIVHFRRLHMLFNANEMGWKGIPLERTEEGTEDIRETFVSHLHSTQTANPGSGQIPPSNSMEKRDL